MSFISQKPQLVCVTLAVCSVLEATSALAAGLPTKALFVAATDQNGDGSAARPFNSIQLAVRAAGPGTIIYVKRGVYRENIKIPKERSGSESAPIWLVSQDGPGAAQIAAPDSKKSAIQAFGVDNYVIQNFSITGGYSGIQFNQSGRDFSDMVNNIVIEGNIIKGVQQDGIKVGQADNVRVVGNSVTDTRNEEGIDFVAVNNAVIQANEVSRIGSNAAGIFAKGGSTNVKIIDNYVHDVRADGISAGGNTDATSFKPNFKGYEAKNFLVSGNRVERVGKQPLSVRGASSVVVRGNLLEANSKRGIAVYITRGNPKAAKVAYSANVVISDNMIKGARNLLGVDPGNANSVKQSRNGLLSWNHVAGLRAAPQTAVPIVSSAD